MMRKITFKTDKKVLIFLKITNEIFDQKYHIDPGNLVSI